MNPNSSHPTEILKRSPILRQPSSERDLVQPCPDAKHLCIACLCATILLATQFPAHGQVFPLPEWLVHGGGINSTWEGSSTGPDNAELSATLYGPPAIRSQYVSAAATSSQEVVQIAPATTYTLTFSAKRSAGGGTCLALMQMEDGKSVINTSRITGTTWRKYTNSFTTGGPNDSMVGRPLNVQFALMKSFTDYGTISATFTNIQLQVSTTSPVLFLRKSGEDQIELRWSTNSYWYVPEQISHLQEGEWEGLPNLPSIEGDHYSIQVKTDERQRLFRLRY